MIYVAIVIVIVLTFTSETYGEVPVLILTFVVALVLNQGTNFLMGKISFVSNSVTSILQLALSIDYAIIFCNRFKEEHRLLDLREAVIVSLSKSIPEIGASSLTTIGGLVAMLFMQFKLGPDMALCLIKSILFALLSAFVVMPGLLMLFGPLIDRTQHRSFVPKIPFVGNFDYATRHVVPVIFALLITVGFFLSSRCPFAYGYSLLTTPIQNDNQIAEQMIEDTFTSSNMLALMVPAGDYDKEAALLAELPPIRRFEAEPEPAPELPEGTREVTVTEEDGVFFVEAEWLERLFQTTDIRDTEGLQYFQRVLRSTGVIDALVRSGVQEGDTVSIYGFKFDYME